MINIVFLSSEITKGMKSFGPKAMIPIGIRKPEALIIKQIQTISNELTNRGTKFKINIVVGFESDKVCKLIKQQFPSVRIIEHTTYQKDNTAGAVLLALNTIGKSHYLFIDNGIITNYCPESLSKSIIPLLKHNDSELFSIGATASDRIEYMFYDLIPQWSEILFISKNDFDSIHTISSNTNINHLFFFEYLNLLIEKHVIFIPDTIGKMKVQKILNHKNRHKNVNIHTTK